MHHYQLQPPQNSPSPKCLISSSPFFLTSIKKSEMTLLPKFVCCFSIFGLFGAQTWITICFFCVFLLEALSIRLILFCTLWLFGCVFVIGFDNLLYLSSSLIFQHCFLSFFGRLQSIFFSLLTFSFQEKGIFFCTIFFGNAESFEPFFSNFFLARKIFWGCKKT